MGFNPLQNAEPRQTLTVHPNCETPLLQSASKRGTSSDVESLAVTTFGKASIRFKARNVVRLLLWVGGFLSSRFNPLQSAERRQTSSSWLRISAGWLQSASKRGTSSDYDQESYLRTTRLQSASKRGTSSDNSWKQEPCSAEASIRFKARNVVRPTLTADELAGMSFNPLQSAERRQTAFGGRSRWPAVLQSASKRGTSSDAAAHAAVWRLRFNPLQSAERRQNSV